MLAWALLLAFGLNVGELLKSFPPLYVATGNPDFGGDTFSEIVQWLVVIDIAAVGLGTATGTMRGIFALARDAICRGRSRRCTQATRRRTSPPRWSRSRRSSSR